MVVERHDSSFLNEEQDESVVVVIGLIDCNSVQVVLPVVVTLLPIDAAEVFELDSVHLGDHVLTGGVDHGRVEEGTLTCGFVRCQAE